MSRRSPGTTFTSTSREMRSRFRFRRRTWSAAPWGIVLTAVMGLETQASAQKAGTWKQMESGTTSFLGSVQFLSAREGWSAGTEATLLKTSDAGQSWTVVNVPASQDAGLHSVQFIDSSV